MAKYRLVETFGGSFEAWVQCNPQGETPLWTKLPERFDNLCAFKQWAQREKERREFESRIFIYDDELDRHWKEQ